MTTFGLTLFLDGRQFQAQAKLSAKEMDRLGRSAAVADKQVRKAGAGMKLAGAASSRLKEQIVGLGVAFVGLTAIRDVIGVLKGFEQTMAFVRGVTQATEEEFAQLTKTARDLGATTRFTAQQAGEGLLLLSRAGFTATESMAAVAATLDLAVAGGLELARATEVAAASIRQFNLEADEARRVADVLVNTTNQTNTNVDQLGESMKFAGPVAGALGIQIENAAAAIGVLGDAGLQGSLAGTALRGSLAALLQTTDRGRAALASLGLTLEDVSPIGQNLTDIFTKLRDANFGAAEAVAIFGRRQASGALVLARNVDKVRDLTEANENAAGAASDLAKIADDTLNGALLALRSAYEEAFLAAGDSGLGGSLRELVDFATQVTRALAGVTVEGESVSAEVRVTKEAIEGLIFAIKALIAAGLLRFLANSTVALISFTKAAGTAKLSTSGYLLVVTAAVVAIREFTGSTNAGAESLERLADAQKAATEAASREDLTGQIKALKTQRDELNRIRDDITAQREGTFAGAGFFRELEEGAGGETTTPVIGQLRQLGSRTLLFLGGQEENLTERQKQAERVEEQLRQLEGQLKINRRQAEIAQREQENLILDLVGKVTTEALFSRFDSSDIASVVGPERFAQFQQELTDNFTATIEDAFSDSAVELRQRLAGATGKVRDSLQEAIDRIALNREDLRSGVPEALREIRNEVDKELGATGRAIDDQVVELTRQLREAQERLTAEATRTRTGRAEFQVSAEERQFRQEVDALEQQLRELQQLRQDVQQGTREALVAERQRAEVSRSLEGLTKSLATQREQIGLTDQALRRYNAEQALANAITAVGAENTEFAAEAQKKLNDELVRLEQTDSSNRLKEFGDQVDRIRQQVIGEGFDLALGDDAELANLKRRLDTLFSELGDDSAEAREQFRALREDVLKAFEFVRGERRFAAFDKVNEDVGTLLDSLEKQQAQLGLTEAERRKADAIQQLEDQFNSLADTVRAQRDAEDPARQEELEDLAFARAIAIDQVTKAMGKLTAAELEQQRTQGREALDAQVQALRDRAAVVGLNADAARELNAVRETTRILDEAGITNEQERAAAIGRTLINLQALREAEADGRQADAIEATRKQTDEFQKQLDTIGLTGLALERYNTINALRAKLEETGALKTREGVEALKEAERQFNELAKVKALKGVFDEVAQSLGTAFTDFIVGAKSAEQALEDFLKQVSRALVQKAVASLIGGVGQALFAPSAKGNVFAQNGIQAFARGGVVDSPTLFPFANGVGLMGEAGPEAILPLTRGADGTLGVQADGMGGGGITIIQNITTPDADSFRKSQKQNAAAVRKTIGQARGNAGR